MENTHTSTTPKTISGRWMILAALRAYGGDIGTTHLHVLIARFDNSRPTEPVFQYVSYDRGLPWSGGVRDGVRELCRRGLVVCRHEGRTRLHALTETGARRAEMVAAGMDHAVAAQLGRCAAWVRARMYIDDLVGWTDTPAARTEEVEHPVAEVVYIDHPGVRVRRRA